MKRTKCFIQVLFISSAIFLTTACTPRMNGLYQDPSFTYDAMTRGGIAIGGVAIPTTKTGDPQTTAEETHYAELLRESIINQRPEVMIMPAGDIAQTMGKKYDKMIEYYTYRDVAADEYLQLIKTKTQNIRYLMLANLNQNKVDKSRQDTGDNISYTTYRSIGISVKIYDLMTSHIVWSGSLSDSLGNTNNYPVSHVKTNNDIVSLVDNVVGDLEKNEIDKRATYPAAPNADQIVDQVFNGIAANLPKKPKKK